MKNLHSLLPLLILLLLAKYTQATPFQYDGDPYLSQSFSLAGTGDLKVATSGSAITVTGKSGNVISGK